MKSKLLTLLLFCSAKAICQTVSGTIIDENSRPASFVSVINSRTQASTYSNEDGKFTIGPAFALATDTILFHHIGYQQIKLALSQIDTSLPLRLVPTNYSLHEVLVRLLSAEEIFREAMMRIDSNYPSGYTMNHAIYKAYARANDIDRRYYYFDCNIYLPDYRANDTMGIYTGDIHHEMYTMDGNQLGRQVSPKQLLTEMYPEKILDLKQYEKKSFAILSRSTTIDSEEYTVIKFRLKPAKYAKKVKEEGTIYINNADKGIRFAETHINPTHPVRLMLLLKVDSLNCSQKLSFKKVNGKYVLDYITTSEFTKSKMLTLHMKILKVATIKVLDRKMALKPEEVKPKNEVEFITGSEKPKDIKELKRIPDMN